MHHPRGKINAFLSFNTPKNSTLNQLKIKIRELLKISKVLINKQKNNCVFKML